MNRLPPDKQVAVVAALCEGMSIRAIERLTGIHRDTIMRLGVEVGTGCGRIHDYLMNDLNVATLELDELWSYVGKKQRRIKPEEKPSKGDFYTFIALDAVNKAIVCYRTGKRDGDTTEFFLTDLASSVVNRPVISSDAFRFYEPQMRKIFGKRAHYGQVVKLYEGDRTPDLPNGVEASSPWSAARRYSPAVVVGIQRKPVIGKPPPNQITTSHVERQNLTVRMSARRFTRLTNAYSKKVENHAAAVHLYVAHYNFCRVHEALRITPAMALGVADHVWSIAELVEIGTTGELPSKRRRPKKSTRIDTA